MSNNNWYQIKLQQLDENGKAVGEIVDYSISHDLALQVLRLMFSKADQGLRGDTYTGIAELMRSMRVTNG